jgi:hypothetical protein
MNTIPKEFRMLFSTDIFRYILSYLKHPICPLIEEINKNYCNMMLAMTFTERQLFSIHEEEIKYTLLRVIAKKRHVFFLSGCHDELPQTLYIATERSQNEKTFCDSFDYFSIGE